MIFQKIIYFKALSPFARFRAWDSPMAIKGTRSRAAVCHIAEQDFDDTIPLQPDRKPDIPEPLLCCHTERKLDRFHPLFKIGLKKKVPGLRLSKMSSANSSLKSSIAQLPEIYANLQTDVLYNTDIRQCRTPSVS